MQKSQLRELGETLLGPSFQCPAHGNGEPSWGWERMTPILTGKKSHGEESHGRNFLIMSSKYYGQQFDARKILSVGGIEGESIKNIDWVDNPGGVCDFRVEITGWIVIVSSSVHPIGRHSPDFFVLIPRR